MGKVEAMLMSEVRAERLLRAIDPEVRRSLSPQQEAAIRTAAGRSPWQGHLVDIRLSLPIPGLRCYLTMVAGQEKRSAPRRRQDRALHPLNSLGNVAVFTGATIAVGLMAFGLLSVAAGLFSL